MSKLTFLVFVPATVTLSRRWGWSFQVRALTPLTRRDLWDHGFMMPAGRL